MTPAPRKLRAVEMTGVNRETGEVTEFDGIMAEDAKPQRASQKRNRRHKVWALVDMADAMAKLELTRVESKVFWALAARVNPNTGDVRFTAAALSAEIGMAAPNISRTIGLLCERKLLIRVGASAWIPSPWVVFYGSAVDWEIATEKAPEPIWSRP